MKGNEKVIQHLNARLAEELGAINQYFVHAEMCDNWKYERLHKVIRERAIVEMKHEVKDSGTRELLDSILKDEEDHIDWIEAQLDQIKQMGQQNYLSEQID
jgi:bacterioferritin